MSFLTDWRAPCAASDLKGLERTDFAFEFLRRNPDYRQDHARTMARIAAQPGEEDAARAAFEQRWGLRFPRGPEPLLPRADPALDA